MMVNAGYDTRENMHDGRYVILGFPGFPQRNMTVK